MYFELFIFSVIVLNTLVMLSKWLTMTEAAEEVTEKINLVFTWVFIIEAIIKLCAFQCRYFHDTWNLFDFTIVCASILGMSLQFLSLSSGGFKSASQIVRTFRIGRMFKLFRKLKHV